MIAKAMGPQNSVGAIGISPSTVDTAVRSRGLSRFIDADTAASRTPKPRRPFVVDLRDQDDRVLRDHPDQREDPEDRHEAERPVEQEKRPHHPDETERQEERPRSPPAGSP